MAISMAGGGRTGQTPSTVVSLCSGAAHNRSANTMTMVMVMVMVMAAAVDVKVAAEKGKEKVIARVAGAMVAVVKAVVVRVVVVMATFAVVASVMTETAWTVAQEWVVAAATVPEKAQKMVVHVATE